MPRIVACGGRKNTYDSFVTQGNRILLSEDLE